MTKPSGVKYVNAKQKAPKAPDDHYGRANTGTADLPMFAPYAPPAPSEAPGDAPTPEAAPDPDRAPAGQPEAVVGKRRVVVCVTGGRHFGESKSSDGPVGHNRAVAERTFLRMALLRVMKDLGEQQGAEIVEMAHGGATGADTHARLWALDWGIPTVPYVANWPRYGPAAGPIRNRQMLRDAKPDLLIAFPGGTGTNDCVEAALEMDRAPALLDYRDVVVAEATLAMSAMTGKLKATPTLPPRT